MLTVSDTQTVEQALKPIGEVMRLDPCPAFEDVKTWDNEHQMYWYDIRKSKTMIYADDEKTIISRKNCRNCLKEIKPYTKKYFKKVYELGCWTSFELSKKSCYCEDCAKEITKNIYFSSFQVAPVIERVTRFENNEYLETKVFADGSVIEDMDYRERVRNTKE